MSFVDRRVRRRATSSFDLFTEIVDQDPKACVTAFLVAFLLTFASRGISGRLPNVHWGGGLGWSRLWWTRKGVISYSLLMLHEAIVLQASLELASGGGSWLVRFRFLKIGLDPVVVAAKTQSEFCYYRRFWPFRCCLPLRTARLVPNLLIRSGSVTLQCEGLELVVG